MAGTTPPRDSTAPVGMTGLADCFDSFTEGAAWKFLGCCIVGGEPIGIGAAPSEEVGNRNSDGMNDDSFVGDDGVGETGPRKAGVGDVVGAGSSSSKVGSPGMGSPIAWGSGIGSAKR